MSTPSTPYAGSRLSKFQKKILVCLARPPIIFGLLKKTVRIQNQGGLLLLSTFSFRNSPLGLTNSPYSPSLYSYIPPFAILIFRGATKRTG